MSLVELAKASRSEFIHVRQLSPTTLALGKFSGGADKCTHHASHLKEQNKIAKFLQMVTEVHLQSHTSG